MSKSNDNNNRPTDIPWTFSEIFSVTVEIRSLAGSSASCTQ